MPVNIEQPAVDRRNTDTQNVAARRLPAQAVYDGTGFGPAAGHNIGIDHPAEITRFDAPHGFLQRQLRCQRGGGTREGENRDCKEGATLHDGACLHAAS